MNRFAFAFALGAIIHLCHAVSEAQIKVEPDKENVVASRIEGDWQSHAKLTEQLTGNPKARPTKFSFKSDESVVAKIPEKYATFFVSQKLKVYFAGFVMIDGKSSPFVLTQIRGNPYVFFWLERNGDPYGNGESFNVVIVPAKDQQNDLLFVGGDFNNQPFSAFERTKSEPKK